MIESEILTVVLSTSTAQLIYVLTGAVVIGVVTYAAYTTYWVEATSKTDDGVPEVVKIRTERWSEEAGVNPAFPPGQAPPTASPNQGNLSPSSQDDPGGNSDSPGLRPGSESSGLDTTEMEFHWQTETNVSFDDIGGMDDLKAELRAEVIKPLENREKAEELGVSSPNIVFYGPPGTGKTYTAEALATELNLPFAKLSGADLQSMWINESATMVNDLFTEAQQLAAKEGGAVVFLDELDSVLKARSGSRNVHEEDTKVVNEFLNHLESTKDHDIVFIGATNRLESIDEAGIRPGRIDKKIFVGKPDVTDRASIIRAQLADRPHQISDTGITALAAKTGGAVASDLKLLVERAAMQTLARDGDEIHWNDIRQVCQTTTDE